jgi:hypothetical protein
MFYASGLSEHGGKINNNGTLLACLNSYSLCSWPLRNQLPQPQRSQELETTDLNTTSFQEQAITGFSKLNLLSPNIGSLPLNWGILY